MVRRRRIEYYRTRGGRCPVEEFFDSLSPKALQRVFYVLKLLEDLERVPKEYFKKLSGSDGIWECRVRSGSNAYRILSFFFRGNTVVLTNGYSKKGRKLSAREIKRAQNCRRDYLSRKAGR